MQPFWYTLNTRWWSPLQWLRIVAMIWLDQKRYWCSLRPVLRWNPIGLSLLAQGIAGTLLLALPMTTLVYVLTSRVIGTLETPHLGRLLLITAGVVLAIAVVESCIHGVAKGLVSGTIFGLATPFITGVMAVQPSIPFAWQFVIAWMIGVGVGLSTAIERGKVTGMEAIAIAVMIGFPLVLMQQSLLRGLVGGSLYGLGYYLGARWGTRQINDPVVRQQLARPEATPDQKPRSQADEA